jgi:hypothetical protein
VINITLNQNIDLKGPTLKEILKAFVKIIRPVFESIVKQAIMQYAEQYLQDGTLTRILGWKKVVKKAFTETRTTFILTPFGKIKVPQYQVRNPDNNMRKDITRLLLGIKPMIRIPDITIKYIGLMGSLAPLRVVNKFLELYSGMKYSLMTIVRCMRKFGDKIKFGVDLKETNEFMGDGTGLPILGSGKRGKELEILAQKKKKGGIRIAGMVISGYKKGWKRLFGEVMEDLKILTKRFKRIFLITDGDISPLKELEGLNVVLQRCLFHIVHELKYTLWQDKIKRKSQKWIYILAEAIEITNVKRVREEPEIAKKIIKSKIKKLKKLIHYCEQNRIKNSFKFLKNAELDIFSGIERKISGGTTSLLERVMRTINQRINVAQWSSKTALAVAKIRGAYYYNGLTV